MTFVEMCAECPSGTNFAINNILKGDYQLLLDMLNDCGANIRRFLSTGSRCNKKISLRFDRDGNFCGYIMDASYKTIRDSTIRNYVMGGNYEFADLEFYYQATLDVMSVL